MTSSKSTANDALTGTRKVSQAEIDAFTLSPHLIRLMWDEPFFARVIRGIQKIKTTAIPTAGVLAKDGEVRFWWNPAFLASLTPDQVKGLKKNCQKADLFPVKPSSHLHLNRFPKWVNKLLRDIIKSAKKLLHFPRKSIRNGTLQSSWKIQKSKRLLSPVKKQKETRLSRLLLTAI